MNKKIILSIAKLFCLFSIFCALATCTELRFHCFSVGHANLTLLTKGRDALFVDCGTQNKKMYKSVKNDIKTCLDGVENVSIMITHNHTDHLNRLKDLKGLITKVCKLNKGKFRGNENNVSNFVSKYMKRNFADFLFDENMERSDSFIDSISKNIRGKETLDNLKAKLFGFDKIAEITKLSGNARTKGRRETFEESVKKALFESTDAEVFEGRISNALQILNLRSINKQREEEMKVGLLGIYTGSLYKKILKIKQKSNSLDSFYDEICKVQTGIDFSKDINEDDQAKIYGEFPRCDIPILKGWDGAAEDANKFFTERVCFRGAKFTPIRPINYPSGKSPHCKNLMLTVQYGKDCLLLPGDSIGTLYDKIKDEARSEEKVRSYMDILSKVTVMLLPHHGSHTEKSNEIFDFIKGDKVLCLTSSNSEYRYHVPKLQNLENSSAMKKLKKVKRHVISVYNETNKKTIEGTASMPLFSTQDAKSKLLTTIISKNKEIELYDGFSPSQKKSDRTKKIILWNN